MDVSCTIFDICDPAWEDGAYVHIKFDHFFELWGCTTLHPKFNLSMKLSKLVARAHKGKFNTIYRTSIAYTCTESKISEIIWRGSYILYT